MVYLQPSIAQALPELRAEAQARMVSTAVIRRRIDHAPQDEESGAEAAVWLEVYNGPCRIGGNSARYSPSTTSSYAEGVGVEYGVRTVHLPTTASDLRDGDLLEVTGGETAGTVWRLDETDWQDQSTARRIRILATERPEEWP